MGPGLRVQGFAQKLKEAIIVAELRDVGEDVPRSLLLFRR
jgi:hypothetical protein